MGVSLKVESSPSKNMLSKLRLSINHLQKFKYYFKIILAIKEVFCLETEPSMNASSVLQSQLAVAPRLCFLTTLYLMLGQDLI